MRNKLLFLAACALLAGCSSNDGNVKGIVTDASMNTVTIINGNDSFTFSTINADKTGLDGLLVGDSIEVQFAGEYKFGMEAGSVSTVSKVATDSSAVERFRETMRLENVDGKSSPVYVHFSEDSLKAELYFPADGKNEVLDRRTLPSGRNVWNVEDDTKNLRYENGGWAISRRGKLLYRQPKSDNDSTLGAWKELQYTDSIAAYRLCIRHREHSGDGYFMLNVTDVTGETTTYIGKRYTLRGMPSDSNATVWQLVADNEKGAIHEFLYNPASRTLTLLDGNQFIPSSPTVLHIVP